jgi:D-ribose pyranose/furanose isomerase RbsD
VAGYKLKTVNDINPNFVQYIRIDGSYSKKKTDFLYILTVFRKEMYQEAVLIFTNHCNKNHRKKNSQMFQYSNTLRTENPKMYMPKQKNVKKSAQP